MKRQEQRKPGSSKKARTIARDVLARLAFCNSRRMPTIVNDGGARKEWVGIGWITVGKADGTEVKVV